jgi:hypothetical protein
MNFQAKRAQHTVLPPRTKLRKHRLDRHFTPQSATPLIKIKMIYSVKNSELAMAMVQEILADELG